MLLGEKYRLECILGRGGMAAVFGGRHEWTGRRVAVKLLNHELTSSPEMAERFLREARTAADLRHPNVVDVLDMGRAEDGSVYLVLERLEGCALADLLAPGPLSVDRALALIVPVMRALAFAHRRGVVHRDLKPDNIFIAEGTDGEVVPKLLDFGIAKLIEHDGTSVTRTGAVLGTPDYMSPEQTRGDADLGPSTDIWSMGVVWFECLTGQLPFNGSNASALIIAVATTRAPPILTIAPDLDPEIARVIDRALSHEASERWPDMTAFADALVAARAQAETSPRAHTIATGVIDLIPAARRTVETLPRRVDSPDAESATLVAQPGTKLSWTGSPAPRAQPPARQRWVAIAGIVAVVAALAIAVAAGARFGSSSHNSPVAAVTPNAASPAPRVTNPTPANPHEATIEQPTPIAPTIVAAPVPVVPVAVARDTHAGSALPPAAVRIAANPPPGPAAAVPAIAPPAPIAPTEIAGPVVAPPAVVIAPPPATAVPAPAHQEITTPVVQPPRPPPSAPQRPANAPLTDYEMKP